MDRASRLAAVERDLEREWVWDRGGRSSFWTMESRRAEYGSGSGDRDRDGRILECSERCW